MGEIDTKPIESVQTALSFFDQNTTEQRKNSPTKDGELDKSRELEMLERDLANIKLQLEAKDSAYKQALLKIDHHHNTSDQLSTLLKNSDLQKEFYINESQEAKIRVNELESTLKQMSHKLSESEKAQEQLLHVTNELVSIKGQLLNLETEIAILREAKIALNEEKLQTEELLRQVSEMNEIIGRLEMRAVEVEREKAEILSAKEAELEFAVKTVSKAQDQLEIVIIQLHNTKQDSENHLMEKSAYIESLEVQLKQASDLHKSAEKVASNAVFELHRLKEEMELNEKKKSDQADYISLLETELNQLRTEIDNLKAETCRLNDCIEDIKSELESTKEKENDAQVEIALLKFEIHKGRSKLAAAEAAEARAQSEKSALYNALHQMGLESEETKNENRVLKEAMKVANETKKDDEADTEYNEEASSVKNYEDMTKKVEEENKIQNRMQENHKETENVKKELEFAMTKIGELRTRAEQAISRAEAAEKAKAALEEKMKKRKEHKERRKAALDALREESISRDFSINNSAKNYHYQPLGKVLNMKF